MKIIIQIHAKNDLLCHEALSMAFALASFEHEIQLQLGDYFSERLLNEPNGKFANMLSSLELYDMPMAWVADEYLAKLEKTVCFQQLSKMPDNLPNFDNQLIL